MTQPSDYYAYRRGAERAPLNYEQLRRLIAQAYESYEDRGWFQAHMGKDCVDAPRDIGAYVLAELGRDLWPLSSKIRLQKEAWLFTIIEFLYLHSAKPTDSYNHPWDSCGLHVTSSDDIAGRTEFRESVNGLLERSSPPYELGENGEIWERSPSGLDTLEPEPVGDPSIDDKVSDAVSAFRRYGASEDDKRHAVRNLADVLEYLRATSGTRLPSKDEGYLFDIANNFGIRHHNPTQRTEYQVGPWLDWMFYSFLNAIALASRLADSGSATEGAVTEEA